VLLLEVALSSLKFCRMFLGDTCARNAQEIANVFGEYFQRVYVRDDSQEDIVVDDANPT
jgi:hypothetical protein